MNKIEEARALAHEAHDSIGQKRKYTGEPYWHHTDAVAEMVAKHGGTEDMIIAAHLHDVIEDVYPINKKYSPELISNRFGERPLFIVIGLTDVYTKQAYPDLNRKARHELENERLGKLTGEVHTVKLCDLIHNTSSIVKDDKDFAKVYIKEKLELLHFLVGGNPVLLAIAADQTVAAIKELGLTLPLVMSK